MLDWIVFILLGLFLALLFFEAWQLRMARQSLKHVIHVNGTRGKSTVVRLIDAGLRAGGMQVMSKTTGTIPSVLTVDGDVLTIRRRGRPNIREQISMMQQAAGCNAEVLVVECMALDRHLQWISQHRMLKADVGVITNVRADHLSIMGPTLADACVAIAKTIPDHGVLFTSEIDFFPELKTVADALQTETHQTSQVRLFDDYEVTSLDVYSANVELAVSVCAYLGVPRNIALDGMKDYKRDPFAAALFRFQSGALFVNALSANDPQSTMAIWERVSTVYGSENAQLVIVINSRRDRMDRTKDMLSLADSLRPSTTWLLGSSGLISRRRSDTPFHIFRNVNELPFETLGPESMVLAIGNVAGHGIPLLERVQRMGAVHVQ